MFRYFKFRYLEISSNSRYIKDMNERKSEEAHIPYAPTLLDNAAHTCNEWERHALVMGQSDRNHNRILVITDTYK